MIPKPRPAHHGPSGSGIVPSRKVPPAKISLADYFSVRQGRKRVSPLNALRIIKGLAKLLAASKKPIEITPHIVRFDRKTGEVELETAPRKVSQVTINDRAYISPETAAGQPPDVAANIYVMGLILFELLLGRPAIDPKKVEGDILTVQHLNVLDAVETKLPPLLQKLLGKMLAYRPGQRFQTYEELIRQVRAALARVSK